MYDLYKFLEYRGRSYVYFEYDEDLFCMWREVVSVGRLPG